MHCGSAAVGRAASHAATRPDTQQLGSFLVILFTSRSPSSAAQNRHSPLPLLILLDAGKPRPPLKLAPVPFQPPFCFSRSFAASLRTG